MSTPVDAVGPVRVPSGRASTVRGQAVLLLTLILLGALLAFGWRLLTPYAARLGDEQEAAAAVDSTLALLGIVVGSLAAAFVLFRPGPAPAVRTLTVLVGSVLGAVVSWQLGDHLGTPALRAVGAAFTWPVATSTVIFLGALLPGTSNRLLPPGDRSGPG